MLVADIHHVSINVSDTARALEFYNVCKEAGVNPVIARWGKFRQDDTNVAAAGEFQAAATRLADRAGYK